MFTFVFSTIVFMFDWHCLQKKGHGIMPGKNDF